MIDQQILDQELKSGMINFEGSSCQWYYLTNGFKDVGQVLVFGHLVCHDQNNFIKVMQQLENVAQDLKVKKIIGPLNYSTYLDYRVKLDQWGNHFYTGEPAYSPEINNLLFETGYEIEKKYFSHEFKLLQIKLIAFFYIAGTFAQIKMKFKGYRILKMSKDDVLSRLPEIHQIVDEIFSQNYMYQNISDKDFETFVKQKYMDHINSEATLAIFNRDNEFVGFSLCLNDENNPERFLIKTIGIKKKHTHKGKLNLFLMSQIYKNNLKKFKSGLACLVIEKGMGNRIFKSYSFKHYSYALLSKKLN